MTNPCDLPLLDEILGEWRELIAEDYPGYRNHVHRMIQFCFALRPCDEEERRKIIIAGAFHDLGIWTGDTLDYIPPSLPPAMAYLERMGLQAWSTEIKLMIKEHHKIREFKDARFPLVEIFRKGDLVDFSLGFFRSGLSRSKVEEIRSSLPNAGFHWMLTKRATRWLLRHPFNPAPMFKW